MRQARSIDDRYLPLDTFHRATALIARPGLCCRLVPRRFGAERHHPLHLIKDKPQGAHPAALSNDDAPLGSNKLVRTAVYPNIAPSTLIGSPSLGSPSICLVAARGAQTHQRQEPLFWVAHPRGGAWSPLAARAEQANQWLWQAYRRGRWSWS